VRRGLFRWHVHHDPFSPVFVTDVAVFSSLVDMCRWRVSPKMQVINFYMCMLQERDNHLCEAIGGRKASHFFNSFFMERLLISDHDYTYPNVRRWSKKFDSFALEKIFFPVRVVCELNLTSPPHLFQSTAFTQINISNTHWTMLVVYMQAKQVRYGAVWVKDVLYRRCCPIFFNVFLLLRCTTTTR
jgi:hypothetical protein